MKEIILNNGWQLINEDRNINIKTDLPDDIIYRLYAAKLIDDPYFGMNYKKIRGLLEEDFVYRKEIILGDAELNEDELNICFYGIDTFSEIYFNGQLIGKTENMFLLYRFSIKAFAEKGVNILEVRMSSTVKKMKEIDCKNYFAIFNIPRIFVRKAQCHFGWDWAPDLPSYGIWEKVTMEYGSSFRISHVRCFTHNNGAVTFHVDISDGDERACRKIRVALAKTPEENCGDFTETEISVCGNKHFINLFVDDVRLWWPAGYGEHYLYPYKIELISDGQIVDTYEGNCAFREVKLVQEPLTESTMSFNFFVNGMPVFLRGADWVPAECLTGTIKNEKYEKLITLAKNGNINTLRVWGGGIYEKDIFYELCDREGIMVWQDFMFACADIPEEDADFMDNVLKEVHYQIYRLINHPSIIYWCGGNEKTGTFGKNVTHGDFFCDYILHGIVKTLDPYRPYIRQSPYSFTDIGNELSSGESHSNSCEECIKCGIVNYRKIMVEKTPSFVSECAIMGPSVKETLAGIFPKSKIWPVNEFWYDRFMDNPYAQIPLAFPDRQIKFAEELYGESSDIDQFIARAGNVHAELVQAESDYARSRKFSCGGFLLWMFDDIWPSGTWSLIDYYLRPKQAYYRMKDCYAPLRAAFVYGKDGKIRLYLFCDGRISYDGRIEYGEESVNGESVWKKSGEVSAGANTATFIDEAEITDNRNYLYVKLGRGDGETTAFYSGGFWSHTPLKSDYKIEFAECRGRKAKIRISANSFAKSVCIRFPSDEKYIYSENYVDIRANCDKIIEIEGERDIDSGLAEYCDFVNPKFRKVK